jgi:hypothetical protein
VSARLEVDHPACALTVYERAVDDDLRESPGRYASQGQLTPRLAVIGSEYPTTSLIADGVCQSFEHAIRGAWQIAVGYAVAAQLVAIDFTVRLDTRACRERGDTGEGLQRGVHDGADVAACFAYPAELGGFEGLVAYGEAGEVGGWGRE